MRLGVCTGGGDCPGLNAAIRAVVKRAVGAYGATVLGIEDSFNGLFERPMRARELTLEDVTEIVDRGGTILGTTNHGDPFNLLAGDGKKAKKVDKSDLVLQGYKDLGLDALIVIGGDGTQLIAQKLGKELGLKLVGIPKTIDNDLAGTDQTIGFDTAVQIATEAVSRLKSTAESHDRVMVLEVMGRDAGYIALHAGIAGGANVVLLPEIPFDYEEVLAKIEERRALGRYFSIVVVAEGAYPKGNKAVYQQHSHGQKRLGGIGTQVAQELSDRSGLEARVTVLGHVQRGGSPSPVDRVLATAFGVHAVDLVARGKTGRVVVLSGGKITDAPYDKVAGKARPIDLVNDPYLLAAEAIGICIGRKPPRTKAKGKR